MLCELLRLSSKLFCLCKRKAQLHKYKGALPYELVEKILVDAWCSIGDSSTRWHFFGVVSILSKVWRDVLYDVVLRYAFVESKPDFVMYEKLLSRHDPRARYISIVLDAVDKQFRIDEIAKHVPEARFMCLAIITDRRDYFGTILQSLLAKTESLTHLRICWPPLHNSFACPFSGVLVWSVTHLHIARHPSASLGSILASFPNVTHLRLGTPCFLKNLVPYMSTVRVLILDAPPRYSVYTALPTLIFPSSVPLWNILDALEHGLLKSTDSNPRQIIMNAGRSDTDKLAISDISLSCQNHGVAFECRRIHPSCWHPSHLESGRWDHDAWS
ncbi:hypothetical protein AZE42_02772 [Rhizopogon vesiculosus]|uniref:F-box domain-containing protein n=1 Tax=Rhizopogon vesiculosus TaxID=180088 RepID=A0A1J8QFE9_9AGAM|nr:hypothetical protein AZE42_02772 [Rhizopogon vesiculosus]